MIQSPLGTILPVECSDDASLAHRYLPSRRSKHATSKENLPVRLRTLCILPVALDRVDAGSHHRSEHGTARADEPYHRLIEHRGAVVTSRKVGGRENGERGRDGQPKTQIAGKCSQASSFIVPCSTRHARREIAADSSLRDGNAVRWQTASIETGCLPMTHDDTRWRIVPTIYELYIGIDLTSPRELFDFACVWQTHDDLLRPTNQYVLRHLSQRAPQIWWFCNMTTDKIAGGLRGHLVVTLSEHDSQRSLRERSADLLHMRAGEFLRCTLRQN